LVAELVAVESFARYPQLIAACEKAFEALSRDRPGPILSYVVEALVKTVQYNLDVNRVMRLSMIFQMPYFNQSDVSRRLVLTATKTADEEFKTQLLTVLVKDFQTIPPNTAKLLLPKAIKESREYDLAVIWTQIPRWLETGEHDAAVIRSVYELLQKLTPSSKLMVVVINAMEKCITSPHPELCIYGIKLCGLLAEKRMLPPPVYHSVLRQLFSYPKFSELRYGSYFTRVLTAGADLIDSLPPDEVYDLIAFFSRQVV
jgi:hypothetical protein